MDENDIKKVIAESLKPVLDEKDVLEEAYVAQAKTYSQVSELVSQRTKDTHTELYHDYVNELNRVSAELDTVNRQEADSKHSEYRSLKLDEAYNVNGTYLHELYFSNCFDPHSELFMDTEAYMKLQRDFGTFEHWQADFMACANACGQGWAVCGYNTFLKRYVNTIVSNQSQDVMIGLMPIIVVDMHEHAYFRDYLKDREGYLVAMMTELNWGIIEERVKKVEAWVKIAR